MQRTIEIALPPEYRSVERTLDVKHEEEAICWLWAAPSLLPWDNAIVWLYTPVVGNARWPGDLWGIDSGGNLLIIEAKRSSRNDDAFKDFVAFHQDGRNELSGTHWKEKWAGHLKSELDYPDGMSERSKGQTDGVLPRSNKRNHIRRWPELGRKIDVYIRSATYSSIAIEYLNIRTNNGDPTPYYFALMIGSDRRSNVLSNTSLGSASMLCLMVGHDHVKAVSISCEYARIGRGLIKTELISIP